MCHLHPQEFLQIGVLSILGTSFVLAFEHRAIHASLEESACRLVGTGRHEFVRLVHVAIKIAPQDGRVPIPFTGPEL